jgi:hypothetical protein
MHLGRQGIHHLKHRFGRLSKVPYEAEEAAMPNIRTNLTQLPEQMAKLADELILDKISKVTYYGRVRTLLKEALTCGATPIQFDGYWGACQDTAHHPGDHTYETEWRTREWTDAECVQQSHIEYQPSRYAPVGSRVYGGYWQNHDDVLAIEDDWITVRGVEDGRIRRHCTELDTRRDIVLGPIPTA